MPSTSERPIARPVRTSATLLVVLSMLVATEALAGFAQGDFFGASGVNGYISAYAGANQGENPDPGFELEFTGGFVVASPVVEQTFSGAATASASNSYTDPDSTNSGTGTVGAGFLQFSAQAGSAAGGTSFKSLNVLSGGFVDQITINGPGLTPGQIVNWLIPVQVSGLLSGVGFSPSPGVEVQAYVNQQALSASVVGFDIGGSDPIATTNQQAQWYGVANFIDVPFSRTVNDAVVFSAPVEVGTPFDLGIFALGLARASGNSAFPSVATTSNMDFSSTILWGGADRLLVGGQEVTDFQAISASGIDWTQPAVVTPEPGSVGLALAVLLPLVATRRPRAATRS